MTQARVQIPPKLLPVFTLPRGALRYRAAHGGRGSAKSFTFAKMAAIWGAVEPLRILCTRELQDSIKDSFHAELKNAIASEPWLAAAYDVGVDYLRGRNGTEFLFKGLRHNVGSIKSLAQIDLCIVEEAEDVPEASWQALEPTIRAPRSEIWVIWNPKLGGSPVDSRLRGETPPPRSAIVEMNYTDNPWFPVELDELRQRQQQTLDPNTYAWIWEGEYLTRSDSQVFGGKWRIAEFEPGPEWDGPYQGADWGFSQDPTVAVRCWVRADTLYVEHEAGKVGLELDDTPAFLGARIPDFAKYATRADSARPESISHVKRKGLPRFEPATKGKGSVEDGIEHMRSYREIVVHPRCEGVASEMRLYSYKVDRLSGDVLPELVDANNHYIDAIRYALEPVMRQRRVAGILLPSRRR